jgi:hypothetical protein
MARIRSYWRTRGLLLGVGVAGALTIAGIAYASIPDSNGVIHSCYVDAGRGTLRVIDTEVGEAFGIGEVAIQWNQTGPQGTQGAQGPQGPPGAPGAVGYEGKRIPIGFFGSCDLTSVGHIPLPAGSFIVSATVPSTTQA